MNLTFNPYEGDAGQYYSVREVLERLFTPLPENKLKDLVGLFLIFLGKCINRSL